MMMAKKVNCTEVARRLQTYLDGELEGDWKERVQAHLDDCVMCGLEQDAFSAIKADLSALPSSPPAESEALQRLRDFSARISQEASS